MTNKFWRHINILSQGIEYTPVCDALFSNINRYIDYQHTFIVFLSFLRRYVNNIPSIFYGAVSELAQELVLETKICGFDSHQPHHMFQQLSRQSNRLLSDRSSVQVRLGTPLIGHQLNQQSSRYKEHNLDDRPLQPSNSKVECHSYKVEVEISKFSSATNGCKSDLTGPLVSARG